MTYFDLQWLACLAAVSFPTVLAGTDKFPTVGFCLPNDLYRPVKPEIVINLGLRSEFEQTGWVQTSIWNPTFEMMLDLLGILHFPSFSLKNLHTGSRLSWSLQPSNGVQAPPNALYQHRQSWRSTQHACSAHVRDFQRKKNCKVERNRRPKNGSEGKFNARNSYHSHHRLPQPSFRCSCLPSPITVPYIQAATTLDVMKR